MARDWHSDLKVTLAFPEFDRFYGCFQPQPNRRCHSRQTGRTGRADLPDTPETAGQAPSFKSPALTVELRSRAGSIQSADGFVESHQPVLKKPAASESRALELEDPLQCFVHHAFPGPDFGRCHLAVCPVSTFGCRFYGGEILVIAVAVPEEEHFPSS